MDDDNYVILPSLLQLLSSYHHSQDVYLGRASLDHPIEAAERVRNDGSVGLPSKAVLRLLMLARDCPIGLAKGGGASAYSSAS